MASTTIKPADLITKLALLTIVAWLMLLTYIGSLYGQLGLGMLLIVGGIWTLARSKEVWNNYLARWKKLPAAKRKSAWSRPRRRYFYFNVIVLVPLAVSLGILLVVSSLAGLR